MAVLRLGTASGHHNVAQVDLPFVYTSCSAGRTMCHHLNESLRSKPEVKVPAMQVPTVAESHPLLPGACPQIFHLRHSLYLYLVNYPVIRSQSRAIAIEALFDSHLFQTIRFQQWTLEKVFDPDWEEREGSWLRG